jgi:hypothetical protein
MDQLKLFVAIWLFSSVIFLAHVLPLGSAAWGDGRYYYVYLVSAVVDHDLDFANDRLMEDMYFDAIITPTGRVLNKYSIGPAVFWGLGFIPFHILLSVVNKISGAVINTSGYGFNYQLVVGITAITYGISGLWLNFRSILTRLDWKAASLSLISFFLASNAFFYLSVDSVNSHSVAIFLSGGLVYLASQFMVRPSNWQLVLMSLLVGGLALVRAQDAIFLLVPIWLVLAGSVSIKRKLLSMVMVGGLFSLVFLPQVLVWQWMIGQPISPYMYVGEHFNWLNPQVGQVLFSFNNGLFIYSPILLICLVGLFKTRSDLLSRMGLILFIIQLYVVASWSGWWGGASYGGRMFLSLAPFFMLGLARFYQRYEQFFNRKNSLLFISSLTAVNWASIIFILLLK